MEKKQPETKQLAGCIICGLLTIIGIVASILSLIDGKRIMNDLVQLFLYVLISYYAIVGYKKPHGNLLKYIYLIYAALMLTGIPPMIQYGDSTIVIMRAAEIGILCYVAGRLAKVKENLILLSIAMILRLIGFASASASGAVTIGSISPIITFLDICVAYFLRYKEHRMAGIINAAEK